MTLTDTLIAVVTAELNNRRLFLDAQEGLRGVVIDVKLKPDGSPRAVLVNQQTETVFVPK